MMKKKKQKTHTHTERECFTMRDVVLWCSKIGNGIEFAYRY